METVVSKIQEIVSVPNDDQFKFIVRLTDGVPAMVQQEDKSYQRGTSSDIWLTRKQLLQAIPVRMRPLVNNEILAYVLPDLRVEIKSVEIHLGDMLGNKPVEHDTIVHEIVSIEAAPIALIKEAKEMVG